MIRDKVVIQKPADSQYEIHPILKRRWSPRTFSELPISETEIKALFEAGRWAPSSHNIQPWKVFWGTKGSEAYDRLLSCLNEFNQQWAKQAPLLLIMAYNTRKPDGEENFHALHDIGLFVANLTFQAESMGIAVHQMAGVHYTKAKEELKMPDNFHVATGIAIGYYGGEADTLPEKLEDQEKEIVRERNPQNSFVFNGDYVDRADVNSPD